MKKTFLLAVISFALFSCNNNKSEKTPVKEETVKIEEEHHNNEKDHNHDADSEPIELNNGEKWIMNTEMKPYVLKGEELLLAYNKTNQTDYKKLGKQIEEQNDHLIESCTMEGKSHDELHKWLLPHLELVEELEKEGDPAKAKKIVDDLGKSYQQFHMYFN